MFDLTLITLGFIAGVALTLAGLVFLAVLITVIFQAAEEPDV